MILNSTDAPNEGILLWFTFLVLFALLTGYVEKSYYDQQLTIENASRWVYKRIFAGSLIGLMYGLSPFLFSQYLGIQEEMFIFIVLSAMVTVAIVGYSVMPYHYTSLNTLTMTPLTFYFFSYQDSLHIVLALTALIWQFLLLSKGWLVSKSTINGIRLNEQLKDEIKHHEQTKEKLQILATHDTLTGIPNRRLLMENLERMFSQALRKQEKVILMFLDLDNFKEINDNYGHAEGDFLLQEVAERLKHHIRKSDTLARIGGDEFVLGFVESDDIDILTNRIIDSISEPITLQNGDSVQIGVSIGVSQFPNDGETPEDLIKASDDRMYASKSNGKNRYTTRE